VEVVRYRPGEAIRWLQTGSDSIRKGARTKASSAVDGGDGRAFFDNVKTAAGAVFDYGKGAYTELRHRQAEATEFVLLDDRLDVVRGNHIKSIDYASVKKIEFQNDRAVLVLEKGTQVIKPFAHIVSGKAKVPIGWSRNGIEVPFELLIEELAARCNVEVVEPEK
jgi:hypothetical protein